MLIKHFKDLDEDEIWDEFEGDTMANKKKVTKKKTTGKKVSSKKKLVKTKEVEKRPEQLVVSDSLKDFINMQQKIFTNNCVLEAEKEGVKLDIHILVKPTKILGE